MKKIPYGTCACGCGKKTALAPYTKKSLGWVKGKPVKYIRGHRSKMSKKRIETKYEQEINKLIPLAERIAEERMKERGTSEVRHRVGANGSRFIYSYKTFYFHQAMNELAYEKGLRGWK